MSTRLLMLMAALLVAVAAPVEADEFALVAPQALGERLATADPDVLVLDVRTAAEFDEGHIPGAINIPHDALAARIAELGAADERDVVVYCRSGRRAALALSTLKEAGLRRLFHLEGDYLRWSEENRPLVRAPQQPQAE